MKVSDTSSCNVLVILLVLLASQPLLGCNSSLDYIMQTQAFSGVVYAVRGDEVLLSYASGYARGERQTPNDQHTIFPIASISKVFTAFAIDSLISRNIISSDQNVATYLSSYPWDETLTIDHLLTHRSALVRDVTDLGILSPYESVTLDRLVSMISKAPVAGRAGMKYSYGNANYQVLAKIIEEVTGHSYESYIRKEVFEQTGMYRAKVLTGEHPEDVAFGYLDGSPSSIQLPSFHYSHMIGSGGLACSVVDLASFAQSIKNKLQSNPRLRLGWTLGSLLQRPYLEHTGHLSSGYGCILRIYPDEDLVIIVLLNCLYSDVDQIADAVSACIWEEPLAQLPSIQNNLPSIVGRYVHESLEIPLFVEDRNGVLSIRYATNQNIYLQKVDEGVYRDPNHRLYLHHFSVDERTDRVVYQIQGLVRSDRFLKEN